MKTVTHEGKVYQMLHLYSDDSGRTGILHKFDGGKEYPFIIKVFGDNGSTTIPCKSILEVVGNIGTIEDAPLELEDGAWYMCESSMSKPSHLTVLLYANGLLVDSDLSSVSVKAHYKPLYKMVKA